MFDITKLQPQYGITMSFCKTNRFVFYGEAPTSEACTADADAYISARESAMPVGGVNDVKNSIADAEHRCTDVSTCRGENVYRAEGLGAPHFFTTRGTPDNFMPRDTVTAEKQLHSTKVVYISDENADRPHYCDGFVIDRASFAERGRYVAIRTADCVPILFYDPVAGVAGAVHAGWRGTVGVQGLPLPQGATDNDPDDRTEQNHVPGIAAEALRMMCAHGAVPANIRVAVGACIHSCCFEVRDDFLDSVRDALGEPLSEHIDLLTVERNGRRYFDLPALNAELLKRAGISDDNIMISPHCTCHEDEFFSFRREGRIVGLLYAGIALP